MERPYKLTGRLQDVVALIQVLAYSPLTRRTEGGLIVELKRKPVSSDSWVELATEHCEFFRVRVELGKTSHVSLIARNAQESIVDGDSDSAKPLLSTDVANKLMELAVQLHEMEMRRTDFWKTTVVPLVVAVIVATASVTAAVITASSKATQTAAPITSVLS